MTLFTARRAALVLFALSLQACSTLSEKQCKQGDWYDIGLRDGAEGYGGDRLTKHSEACTEYGITPNREAYEKGRGEGLKAYCAPDHAYRIGRNGGYYRGGCPASLETAFLRKFEAGKQVHDIESRVNRLYNEITDLENDMDKEKDMAQRARLRERIRDRQRERDELQRRLTVLEIKGES
jgi:hypothetical protein